MLLGRGDFDHCYRSVLERYPSADDQVLYLMGKTPRLAYPAMWSTSFQNSVLERVATLLNRRNSFIFKTGAVNLLD